MQRTAVTGYHAYGFKSGGSLGYFEHWLLSFDVPLAADEAIDSLFYRDRCGCTGDLKFHDVASGMCYGDEYRCPGCAATWCIGIA